MGSQFSWRPQIERRTRPVMGRFKRTSCRRGSSLIRSGWTSTCRSLGPRFKAPAGCRGSRRLLTRARPWKLVVLVGGLVATVAGSYNMIVVLIGILVLILVRGSRPFVSGYAVRPVPLVGAPWFALSERNSPGLGHREFVGQAVHERVDAVRRGVPPHVRRPVRPGAQAPARTSRPGWSSTSVTATATSSRDCNRGSVFRKGGGSPV
jgi:hypothetical protein